MSMVSSAQTNIIIKSKKIAELFSQYRDIILSLNEDRFFPCSVEIKEDTINLEIPSVDSETFCPKTLDSFLDELINLFSGDVALLAALEDDEDPGELEEEFGEIVPFAADMFSHAKELVESLVSAKWETITEEYEESKKTEELFTFERSSGEQYTCRTEAIKVESDVEDGFDFSDSVTCDFCNRECAEDEIVRKRSPDGSISTVCEQCCVDDDLSDWETVVE